MHCMYFHVYEIECMEDMKASTKASEAPETSSIRIIHAEEGALLLMKVHPCWTHISWHTDDKAFSACQLEKRCNDMSPGTRKRNRQKRLIANVWGAEKWHGEENENRGESKGVLIKKTHSRWLDKTLALWLWKGGCEQLARAHLKLRIISRSRSRGSRMLAPAASDD